MTTNNILYDASFGISITLDALASSSTVGEQSAAVSNASTLYDDFLVTAIIVTSASALAAPNTVYVYATGSEDGVNYEQDSAAISGGDVSYTIDLPTNLRLLGTINCSTSSKTYKETFRLAYAFGGTVPRKWRVIVINNTGQALGTGNSMSYTGINYTNA